jgi:hypothetical protein
MHLDHVRVSLLGLSLLAACESKQPGAGAAAGESDSNDPDRALVAGGQTSEFSGGDVAFGYCPQIESRTVLDLASEDVAKWVALAEGQHEISLRWQREFPDERVRGFQERTSLLLDVQVLAAEDVVCVSNSDDTSYETSGYRASLRRLELAVEFSTADGAVRGAFQGLFVVGPDGSGGSYLFGGEEFPIDELEGALELGVDPELDVDLQALYLNIGFGEQGVAGSLTPWVVLSGPYDIGGGRPSWRPVMGIFPAPDEGCNAGSIAPLDTIVDALGDTPRAAYERARASLPAQPLRAAWEDSSARPVALAWTELLLRPGAPTHACISGNTVDVFTSLGIESTDGLALMDHPAIANVSLAPASPGQPRPVTDITFSASLGWTPRAEFEAIAGLGDMDLGLAEYGGLYVYQSFNVARDELRGEVRVNKWENYVFTSLARPALTWCNGPDCEHYWCIRNASDDGTSCNEPD